MNNSTTTGCSARNYNETPLQSFDSARAVAQKASPESALYTLYIGSDRVRRAPRTRTQLPGNVAAA